MAGLAPTTRITVASAGRGPWLQTTARRADGGPRQRADGGPPQRHVPLSAPCPPPSPRPDDGYAGPACLPAPDAADDAGDVVHLGRQHPLPARCRTLQHRGLRGQRLLLRRHGPLRGAHRACVADTRGRRFSFLLGAATLLALDAAVPGHVAGRGAVHRLGGGVDPAGTRLHVLQRRHRGLARRCPASDRLTGQPGDDLRPWPDRRRRGDADGIRARWRRGTADEPGRPLPVLRAVMLGIALAGRLLPDARPRLRAAPGRQHRDGRARGRARRRSMADCATGRCAG